MKNGYFQLVCSPQGVALKLYKPENGGEAVSIKEVSDYLTAHQIPVDYNILSKGFQSAEASTENQYMFAIVRGAASEVRGSYNLFASPDRMTLTARFYAPSEGGESMTADEFLKDLYYRKLTYGIQEQEIRAFFENPVYCTDILVAIGKQPRHGSDARIEYYFQTDRKAKPTLNEDGSVDFFHLNTISHCKKGDLLARLIPEDRGEEGYSIYGEVIKPRDVKRASLKYGRNITISEDRMTLTSDVNGHVMLYGNKVFVSDVLEVENVDISTGNISYEGSVKVNGNVLSGFEVKASGNIVVAGVVEGAILEAEGDVIIERGINGMGKGRLIAGGNIVAKFIENTYVQAGGSVSTESILHSNVSAGTFISVTGKKGFITGGKVCATSYVTVKTLGSEMGADTLVEVGMDPIRKARIVELQKSIGEKNKMMAQIKPVLTAWTEKISQGVSLKPDQIKMLKEMVEKEKKLNAELEAESEEFQELYQMYNESTNAKVEVTGSVFSGTKIAISDVSLVVKNSISYCKFVKDHGDVKVVGL